MTVLQLIIREAKNAPAENYTINEFIKVLETYLDFEEQQIRDAWEASERHYWQEYFGAIPNPEPDIEAYITNLKK